MNRKVPCRGVSLFRSAALAATPPHRSPCRLALMVQATILHPTVDSYRIISKRHQHAHATPPPKIPSPSPLTSWSAFSAAWNTTLARHPQTSIASFLATQSTCWLVCYSALYTSGWIFPPELAAGWMVARLTKKVRQPINVGLAAAVVAMIPSIAAVRVSPLVTGFVATDRATRRELRQAREKIMRLFPGNNASKETALNSLSKGVAWLEGPVDKYGLAFYLSGKVTSLSTMWASSYLLHQGVDVSAMLAEWGIAEQVGTAAGTVAGAATANAFLVPLHFLAVVYGVRGMEVLAGYAVNHLGDDHRWRWEYEQKQQLLHKGEDNKPTIIDRNNGEAEKDNDGAKKDGRDSNDENDNETYQEYVKNLLVKNMGMCLLFYSLLVSLYAVRLMKKTATTKITVAADGSKNGEESNGPAA